MNKKILIVHGDPIVKMSLEAELSQEGYETANALDGKEALDKVLQAKPDIIISGIKMPHIDGYKLHGLLRQNKETSNIPFIFLPGKGEVSEQLKALQMGADDYLIMPVIIKVLLSRIVKVLEKSAKACSFRNQVNFKGNVGQLNMSDVQSIVEMNCKSGELILRNRVGRKLGSVHFRDGKLINALKYPLSGEDAFYDLVGEKNAYYEFFSKKTKVPQRIVVSNMIALLNAKILLDEGGDLFFILSDIDVQLEVLNNSIPKQVRAKAGDWCIDKILDMIEKNRSVRTILYAGGMSRFRAASILVDLFAANALVVKKEHTTNNTNRRFLLKGLKDAVQKKLTGIFSFESKSPKSAIFVKEGKVVHAFYINTSGKKALFRILSNDTGLPHFNQKHVVAKESINCPLSSLLNEWSAEDEWLQNIKPEELDKNIIVNIDVFKKVTSLKKNKSFLNIISLVHQYGQIRDILNASPLSDMKIYNSLLSLVKRKVLSFDETSQLATQIITDSTADLPPEIIENHNIVVAPLSVTIDKKTFRDGIDISPDTFYQQLKEAKQFPYTTPVSTEEFHALFSKISAKKNIIGIFISKRMSQTYQHALSAKSAHYDEYIQNRSVNSIASQPLQIEVLDSEMGSLPLGLIVMAAAEKIKDGWTLDKVRAHLEGLIPLFRTYFLVDTLEYLKRGGRIGKARALLGTLLNIKPVLSVANGEIVSAEQVRGRVKGQKRLVELVDEELSTYDNVPRIRVGIIHANVPEKAEQLHQTLKKKFLCDQITVSKIGPTTGTHLGPGTIAVTFYPLLENI